MLTVEQINNIPAFRRFGYSYTDIANIYGSSIADVVLSDKEPKRNQGKQCNNVVYPAIYQIIKAEYQSISRFANACGVHRNCMRLLLTDSMYNPTKDTIDGILAVTGLSYEEAFDREWGS